MEGSGDLFSLDVVEFFNAEFGSDLSSLKKLPDVLKKVESYEKELENQVNPENLDPSNAANYSRIAEESLQKITELEREADRIEVLTKSELEKMKPIEDNFSQKIKELKEVESLYCYLQWLLKIEEENSKMDEAVKNSPSSEMVENFSTFRNIWEDLKTSRCKNLVEYVKKTVIYWHNSLKAKFESEFKKVLFDVNWPVRSPNLNSPIDQSPEVLEKFKELFVALIKISLPQEIINAQDELEVSENPPLLLPLQIMLQPFQKRFHFHFMQKGKVTCRIDKPEWFLTQILSWISDHTVFIEETVQPILDDERMFHICARNIFMRGLVQLAILRIENDLPILTNNDLLLCHTIDEILLFSQELRNQGYPLNYPNIMQLLTDDQCFARWKKLEHQSALDKMDRFLSSDSSWQSRYQDESDLDEMKVPECAELFITLLLTMTERYCNLEGKDYQLSFLDLQLELLDDFRLRLHQLSQCEVSETVDPKYCSIMNAIYYISSVLEEWNNLPFFLDLHVFKKKKGIVEDIIRNSEKQYVLAHRPRDMDQTLNEDELLEVSVFDETIALFAHMQKDLMTALCDRVLLDIKAKSRPYRKEKWFCMPTQDKKYLEITLAALPMLEVISISLHKLEESLSKPLFTKVWQQIASELNIYLFEEVILQNSFSEGGAAQLNFDMTRNLFPIFGAYTLKPDQYFKLVRDSCVLLNLLYAPAMLLKETLKCHENIDAKRNALEELGVYSLSPSQALIILDQRNYANVT